MSQAEKSLRRTVAKIQFRARRVNLRAQAIRLREEAEEVYRNLREARTVEEAALFYLQEEVR